MQASIKVVFLVLCSILCSSTNAMAARLQGHIPHEAIAKAQHLGALDESSVVQVSLNLPLRNQQELAALIQRFHSPSDPLYGKFLTTEEFTTQFAPTQQDYDAVTAYAQAHGFNVTKTQQNRTMVNVSATAGSFNKAFNLTLHRYKDSANRVFYAPDSEPVIPDELSNLISGVVGLNNASVPVSHLTQAVASDPVSREALALSQIGTGPGNGMAPADIRKAYNMSSVSATGTGQTLGLVELAGYNPADIAQYVKNFGLSAVTLQNIYLDGAKGGGTGSSGPGVEVTLDIELQMALAPGASKIMVYQASQDATTAMLDIYNQIANDNIAKQISCSWGQSESELPQSFLDAENSAFMQMAAQGQSFYVAAGDSGAYIDTGACDPATEPYVTSVGGTKLSVNADGSYKSETTWNDLAQGKGAGGGGVSAFWPVPSYQQGVHGVASSTMRNVPDVSLNADPNTAYAVYVGGGWMLVGGTSCAAPLWSAFTACVNQQRVANNMPLLGFANPTLYELAAGPQFASDFHDINDSSTNGYYYAVTGYDDATGLGSFNGVNLWKDLTGSSSVSTTYTVVFAAGANGSISGNASQAVAPGSSTSAVTAVPAAGYRFSGWTGSASSSANPLTVTDVTSSMNLTANFVVDTLSISSFSLPIIVNTLSVPIVALTTTGASPAGYYLSTVTTTPTSKTVWLTTAPNSYTFPSAGAKTLNLWIKSPSGTISGMATASTLIDTTPPVITAFTVPAAVGSTTIPITCFTATDNVKVSGYLIGESATRPATTDSGWSAVAPTRYAATRTGAQTLYAWVMDSAGNISTKTASVYVNLTAPIVAAFKIPSLSTSTTITVTTLSATDNVKVAGYQVTESAAPATSGWTVTAPKTCTVAGTGTRTLYAWAIDSVGNVSSPVSAQVYVDTTLPVVTAFVVPPLGKSLTIPISRFTATDNDEVAGYLVTETSALPATSAKWLTSAPTSYTTSSQGTKTLYAWARDRVGNVSTPLTAQTTVDTTVPVTSASPPGGNFYAPNTPTVSLTVSKEAAIYYTMDGSTPSVSSKRYSGPLSITSTTSLKYFSVDPAGNVEAVKTQSYQVAPVAQVNGVPTSAITQSSITFTVAGTNVVSYKVKVDNVAQSAEKAVTTPLVVTGLTAGSHTMTVIGKESTGLWQLTPTQVTWSNSPATPSLVKGVSLRY